MSLTSIPVSFCQQVKFAGTIFFIFVLTLYITACGEKDQLIPRLDTLEAIDSDITSATAILKGEFLSLGNMKIEEYGIEYSKSIYFTSSLTTGFNTTPVMGVFQVEVINLEPVTTYYFKAYALVNTARVYSSTYSHFTTK